MEKWKSSRLLKCIERDYLYPESVRQVMRENMESNMQQTSLCCTCAPISAHLLSYFKIENHFILFLYFKDP